MDTPGCRTAAKRKQLQPNSIHSADGYAKAVVIQTDACSCS